METEKSCGLILASARNYFGGFCYMRQVAIQAATWKLVFEELLLGYWFCCVYCKNGISF